MLNNIEQMKSVKSVKDIDVKDKRVLIRVDFNVPMDEELNISDDKRIREALPTINYCIDNGAKSILLVSHFGRPKSGREDKYSLKHILKRLERLLGKNVEFIGDFQTQKDKIASLSDSTVALIDNIRFYAGETKNDEALSKELATLCDVYVNDAFGASHRKHSSTYGIAQYTEVKVAGLLLKKEIDAFSQALGNPARPMLLIVGGAKVSSKLTLLKSILNVVDKIIIGGAMSNTFLKALGYNMQDSLVEDDLLYESLQILESAKHKNVKIYLPVDVVCTDDLNTINDVKVTPVQDIPKGYMSADIGPATLRLFKEVVSASDTIIWNGPMGVFEKQKFSRGTFGLAHSIADSYSFSVVGGGDTADAVDKAGDSDNMSFISTGGGASLELLEGAVLPSFEVLDKR